MPVRIGFDLDGVLADMDGELVRHAEALFGEAAARRLPARDPASDVTPPGGIDAAKPDPPADMPLDNAPQLQQLQLSARQVRRLWRHAQAIEGFWESLKELEPGVIPRLAAIAADRRWEIIFLTRRPESAGATAQVQSQRWLEAKGFRLPSVYVVQGSRGRIAAALNLDFVIDDRPENCFDVVTDSRARAILVWRDDENALPAAARRLGIGVVSTVAECLDILTQVDAPATDQTSVVDRVKRLLGLKSEASAV